jgi:hypothetical protein
VLIQRALCLLLILGLGVGCGYRLSNSLKEGQKPVTIDVTTFENDTLEPGIELMLGSALRNEFARPGLVRGVVKAASPDYTLEGQVRSVTTTSRTLTTQIRAIEFTVVVRIEPVLVRNADGQKLKLDRLSRSADEVYLASFDLEISRKNREEALRRIAAVLADRIYDDVEVLTAGAGS